MSGIWARLIIVGLPFVLAGCPPSGPVAIDVTDISQADSYYGGLAFSVSGTGFTRNGQVGVKLINAPGRDFIDYTNLPGLATLNADANGKFGKFRVVGRCNDIPDPDLRSQHKNAELWVTDSTTLGIAKHEFSPIECLYYPAGRPPPNPPDTCPSPGPRYQ